MSGSDPLLGVFLDEAVAALAVLEDPRADRARRTRALAGLEKAAELVGSPALGAETAAIVRALGDDAGAAAASLAAMVARLDGGDRPGEVSAAPPPPPRRRSSRFDTDEHRTLLSFFRDEAYEGLDRMTAQLARAEGRPDEAMLDELMRITHGIKGTAGTVDLPIVSDLTHRLESSFDRVRTGRIAWTTAVREAFIEAADGLRALVAQAEAPAESEPVAEALRRELESLGDDGADDDRREDSRLLVVDVDRREGDRRRAETPVLRVDPARVDGLMDSVGELVFDRTRIERQVARLARLGRDLAETRAQVRRAAGSASGDLRAELAAIDDALALHLGGLESSARGLTDDTRALRRTERALQDGLTRVRMQVVRSLYQRLAPQLRAIARAAGKRVELRASGGDTEFDRSVADQITPALIQLLRNAVAHGIEPASERRRAGKPEHGVITIDARHEGHVVVLEVGDDGAGIDVAELRRRLLDSDHWSPARVDSATDDEVLLALFDAGISSRDEVDELAGRGVGLSAVRQTVTRLGGEVLLSSTPGKGTSFRLRLPLTTAVASALLFKLGGHVFAIPNVHVHGTAEVALDGGAVPASVAVGGQHLPLVALHDVLGFNLPEGQRRVPAVALEYAGQRFAISCDKIVGPREIVLKGLGPLLSALPLYAGGTISGSGKVQLILDPAALSRLARADVSGPVAGQPRPAPRGLRVLVVDDSLTIREAMRTLLERAGYEVETAEDGEEAWARLHAVGCDVLITDLEMPQQGGFALIERVRGDDVLAPLPIVIVSSRVDRRSRDRARELDVGEILAKPVTRRQLEAALGRVL